ncbi:MAG: hypothetical protein AAF355_11875 [Myxococcota bacterium]
MSSIPSREPGALTGDPSESRFAADAGLSVRNRALTRGLHALICAAEERAASISRLSNPEFQPDACSGHIQSFLSGLKEFYASDSQARISIATGKLYINDIPVSDGESSSADCLAVESFLNQLPIDFVELEGQVPERSVCKLIEFLAHSSSDNVVSLKSLPTFEGIRLYRKAADAKEPSVHKPAILYHKLLKVLREMTREMEHRRTLPIQALRRTLQEWNWLDQRLRPLQVALMQFPREELSSRLAFVALLVSLLAEKAGLSPSLRRDCALAAALSGIGRWLEPDLTNAPTTDLERELIYVRGARKILPSMRPGPHASLWLISALEQSRDLSRREGHILSRIIATVDSYERLTQPHPFGPALTPDTALRLLAHSSETAPKVARILLHTIGPFPPGTVVILSDGRWATVLEVAGLSSNIYRPIVLLADSDPPDCLDLSTESLDVESAVTDIHAKQFGYRCLLRLIQYRCNASDPESNSA